MATKKLGPVARFGPRYGKRLKAKMLSVEVLQRQKQLCPYCNRKVVRRVSAGIWYCKKCGSKFTGSAYKL